MEHTHHEHRHVQHEHHTASNNTHAHHKETYPFAAHDKHAGHHTADFLKRFWICLTFTPPVLLLSHMILQWAGFHMMLPGDKYVLLLLGTVIYILLRW